MAIAASILVVRSESYRIPRPTIEVFGLVVVWLAHWVASIAIEVIAAIANLVPGFDLIVLAVIFLLQLERILS
jgi:hypothetical protein